MKMKRWIKPGDMVLIAVMGIILLLSFLVPFLSREEGRAVVITSGDDSVQRFSLHENKSICVQGAVGTTLVTIQDGRVWVTEAPCPHRICMHMGKIQFPHEMIVCLPNRILIQIEGSEDVKMDGITM